MRDGVDAHAAAVAAAAGEEEEEEEVVVALFVGPALEIVVEPEIWSSGGCVPEVGFVMVVDPLEQMVVGTYVRM